MLVINTENVCVCVSVCFYVLIGVFNIFPKEKQLKLLTKETKQFSFFY